MIQPFTGLVVPFPSLEPVLSTWRSRLDNAVSGVPAHVTVLAPWIPPDELTRDDLDALGQLVRSWPRFEVTFRRFAQFPGVHYLVPEPSEEFSILTEDVLTGWPEYLPYGGDHGPDPTPHLTMASSEISDGDVAELYGAVLPQLPLTAVVSELAVLTVADGVCRTRASFKLAKS